MANILSSGEPVSRGLIVLGISGALLATMRRLPLRIYSWFLRNFTVIFTVTIENVSATRVADDLKKFAISNSRSRRINLTSVVHFRTRKLVRLPSEGSYFFFKGMRPYLFSFKEKNSDEKNPKPGKVTIRTLGRDINKALRSIDVLRDLEDGIPAKRSYYICDTRDYADTATYTGDIEPTFNFIQNKSVLEEIDNAIERFKDVEFYKARGLTRKLTVLVYGPPGTGKTKIGRYIADVLEMSILKGNNQCGYSRSMTALTEARKIRAIYSLQDIDANKNLHKRAGVENDGDGDSEKKYCPGCNIDDFLNILDGDIPLDDSVIVLSTNHLDKLDDAIYRPGRVDLLLYVGNLEKEALERFYRHYYNKPGESLEIPDDKTVPVSAAMSTFSKYPLSPEIWVKEMNEWTAT